VVEADQMLVIFPANSPGSMFLIPVNIKILPQEILGTNGILAAIHVGTLNGLAQ
jgi:hypothetical protein